MANDTGITTIALGPQERLAVQRIQKHLQPTFGKVSIRAAVTWALNQSTKRLPK